jgi:hypothetical protein
MSIFNGRFGIILLALLLIPLLVPLVKAQFLRQPIKSLPSKVRVTVGV